MECRCLRSRPILGVLVNCRYGVNNYDNIFVHRHLTAGTVAIKSIIIGIWNRMSWNRIRFRPILLEQQHLRHLRWFGNSIKSWNWFIRRIPIVAVTVLHQRDIKIETDKQMMEIQQKPYRIHDLMKDWGCKKSWNREIQENKSNRGMSLSDFGAGYRPTNVSIMLYLQ